MLRNCLESIALQSRRDYIKEVVVSENGPDIQSLELAESFSGRLPIRYIKQDNGLSAQEHGVRLCYEAKTKYVALLADDDIWARYHIEEACRCFREYPFIHAYFGQAIVVNNETCFPVTQFSGSFLQVPCDNNRSVSDFRIWDRRDAAVQCLANTPLNIWSVVALTESHRSAVLTSAGDPVYGKYPSNDRLYIWRISLQGDIGIGRNISLFYRRHPESDIQTCLREDLIKTQEDDLIISMEIARQAIELGIDVFAGWHKEFARARAFGLAERIDMTPQFREFLLRSCSSELFLPQNSQDTNATSGLGKNMQAFYYLLTPPIIKILLNKFKRFI